MSGTPVAELSSATANPLEFAMIDRSDRGEVQNLTIWMLIIVFFMIAPPIMLYCVWWILESLKGLAHDPHPSITELYNELPLVLLSFYSGTLGSIISYIYGRTVLHLETDRLGSKVAKLLFGGLIGVAAFFFLRSAVVIKLLYPKLPLQDIGSSTLTYHSIIILSLFAGLLAPRIVTGIQHTPPWKEPTKSKKSENKQP
jgi:hypothetical protein